MDALLLKISDAIHKHHLLSRGDKILVGVSGGADSVALVAALNALRYDLGISLAVAHYNHALRASSDRDQKFVETLSRKLGLPIITEKNRKRISSRGSLEEIARDLRYDFFFRVARQLKVDAVAVAHTQDDLAETVLMRILRGTGLAGLRSMMPKRLIQGMPLIRPFLGISRSEIECFLARQRLSFVNDPTNRSLEFTRNRTRLKLIPFIQKEFSLDVKKRLAVLADVARVDHDFIEKMGRQAWKRTITEKSGSILINTSVFLKFHTALRRNILRKCVDALKGDEKSWDLKHAEMMDCFISSQKIGRLSLPEGFTLRRSRGGRNAILEKS